MQNTGKSFKQTINQSLSRVSLKQKQIRRDPQRITKISPFIDQHGWKDINSPSHEKDWKKFETNNKSIALNPLFIPHRKKEIRQAYISKHSSERMN